MAPAKKKTQKMYEVKESPIAGKGVFATKFIPKGTRIIEYKGKRIPHAEADNLYADDDNYVFLFIIDDKTVIDPMRESNEARFINHSCDPNCESEQVGRKIFIDAIRDIKAGEELLYDYNLESEDDDSPEELEKYKCRCGAKNCRGTMVGVREETKEKQRKAKMKKNSFKCPHCGEKIYVS